MKIITQLFKDFTLGQVTAEQICAHQDFPLVTEKVVAAYLHRVAQTDRDLDEDRQLAVDALHVLNLYKHNYEETTIAWTVGQFLIIEDVSVPSDLFALLEVHADNVPDADESKAWHEDLKCMLRHAYNPKKWPLPKHLAEQRAMIML